VHRERVDLRRAERDHAADQLGAALSEHLAERAAAALADDRRRAALPLHEPLEPFLEPWQHGAGAVHVGDDPGAAGAVAAALEPAGHHRERAVARQEARDQQHRATAAIGHAVAAEERVAHQGRGLETDSCLPPERGTGSQPARASHQ
jgi:hypothetical protein